MESPQNAADTPKPKTLSRVPRMSYFVNYYFRFANFYLGACVSRLTEAGDAGRRSSGLVRILECL
jgi:hypothetical protein